MHMSVLDIYIHTFVQATSIHTFIQVNIYADNNSLMWGSLRLTPIRCFRMMRANDLSVDYRFLQFS